MPLMYKETDQKVKIFFKNGRETADLNKMGMFSDNRFYFDNTQGTTSLATYELTLFFSSSSLFFFYFSQKKEKKNTCVWMRREVHRVSLERLINSSQEWLFASRRRIIRLLSDERESVW